MRRYPIWLNFLMLLTGLGIVFYVGLWRADPGGGIVGLPYGLLVLILGWALAALVSAGERMRRDHLVARPVSKN